MCCSQYSPPESVSGTVRLTEKIDVYALGRLIFEFLSWYPLYSYELQYDEDLSFSNKSMEEKILQVITNPDKPPQLPQSVENSTDPVIVGLISVMRQALQYNASDRPSAQDVANELEGLYNSTDQRAEVVRTLYYKMPDVLIRQFGSSRGKKLDSSNDEAVEDANNETILELIKEELQAAKKHIEKLEMILLGKRLRNEKGNL